MPQNSNASSQPTIPADDLRRKLAVARPNEDPRLPRIFVAGDIYTILVSGDDTAGRYCLIEMLVPPGGGPPPHRHDFEEMFTVLEGEIEVMFRGERSIARAGETLNIPANAPHSFRNVSAKPARMLCLCSPSGQEKFFMAVGYPVESRTSPPPKLSEAEQRTQMEKALSLAAEYRTEFLKPG